MIKYWQVVLCLKLQDFKENVFGWKCQVFVRRYSNYDGVSEFILYCGFFWHNIDIL